MRKSALQAINNERLRRMATYASIIVATILIIIKLIAYFVTDSVTMLSSLADSTVDLLASLVIMYGVASAQRPPDHDHRYGHGKAEPLAALAQAAFIVGSSVLLCYEALSRLYHPHPVQNLEVGYWVMAVAMVLTIGLLWFQRLVIRRTNSMAIAADRLHYVGDLLINLAVIVTFVLQGMTGSFWFDPLFAIGIAGLLLVSAYHVARDALNVLMDRELPEADRKKIETLVVSQPGVYGMHDLRTRSDSDRVFIDFHLELEPTTTLRAAHVVTQDIVTKIREKFHAANVLIYPQPVGVQEERLDEQIEATLPEKVT